jgi:hypothetical protein
VIGEERSNCETFAGVTRSLIRRAGVAAQRFLDLRWGNLGGERTLVIEVGGGKPNLVSAIDLRAAKFPWVVISLSARLQTKRRGWTIPARAVGFR